ncbi:MAG: hypothetical protein H0W53_00370 [Acidobacteria bacterium]|nr:hypothetical protein [Acidobacteriota bacterium]
MNPRILIIAGSGRRQYNCPGVNGKARTFALRMAKRLPQDCEVDVEDLGNVFGRARDSQLQRVRLDVDGALRLAL